MALGPPNSLPGRLAGTLGLALAVVCVGWFVMDWNRRTRAVVAAEQARLLAVANTSAPQLDGDPRAPARLRWPTRDAVSVWDVDERLQAQIAQLLESLGAEVSP